MNRQERFDRILASLHDSVFDDSLWPETSALIDDACRVKGNSLAFAEGSSRHDAQFYLARFCYRGERRKDIEREYFEVHYARDERAPRLLQLPDGKIAHIPDLFTQQERKTSPTYNEFLAVSKARKGLHVRLDGPGRSQIVLTFADSVESCGWRNDQLDMIKGLAPHLRRYVILRQALADAGGLATSLAGLLNNTSCGVIQLDRNGRIVEINDLARNMLREGDGLLDRGGSLSARAPLDKAALKKVLEAALPNMGGQGVAGSVTIGKLTMSPRLVLHVTPVGPRQTEARSRQVAALVMIVDPVRKAHFDPALVSEALLLTPAESEVAISMANGNSVQDMAAASGRKESTIRWHVKQIFLKQGISRQPELVVRVQSLAGLRYESDVHTH